MTELVRRLDSNDAPAGARMREVVGARRGRIGVDEEWVDVLFGRDGRLHVTKPRGGVDGEGETDRQTVLDLLDGYIEVTEAILDGRLRIRGETDDVARMFVAIEILLDGSTRIPQLQQLARDFRFDPCRPPRGRPQGPSGDRRWHATGDDPAERALLRRHDLLP